MSDETFSVPINDPDEEPPYVVSTTPVDSATYVRATNEIAINFSEPMDAESIRRHGAFVIAKPDGRNVPFAARLDGGGYVAVLKPCEHLRGHTGAEFIVAASPHLKSARGSRLPCAFAFVFAIRRYYKPRAKRRKEAEHP